MSLDEQLKKSLQEMKKNKANNLAKKIQKENTLIATDTLGVLIEAILDEIFPNKQQIMTKSISQLLDKAKPKVDSDEEVEDLT